MIEPILSLSFSIYSNPGVYALLLGSGVSRSANIPTGWEVVLDLIRKLAHLSGEDCEPKPEIWYKNKYEQEADYSKLLDEIAKSPSERSQLLKSYFEPTPEEREETGIKVPTKAHRSIAELVEKGYIKVIITTNFDHLIETALDDIGITPTIISTPDSIEGALPLPHTKCTIIKVNGDYVDTRIKNTPSELEKYDPPLNQLLDRVFDEYGLIICGWSGFWDTALRDAITRCPSRRFTTFWTARNEPKEKAKELLDWRQGVFVPIKDADSLFEELNEKVSSLHEFNQPHPLSAKIAVATLKKYLVEERYKIRLHDLVHQETEKLFEEISLNNFPIHTNYSDEEFIRRLKRYESLSETMLSMMITGCYWGEESHQILWINVINRTGKLLDNFSGNYHEIWLNLRAYPALLMFYSGGIASLAAQKYDTFLKLLTKPTVQKLFKTEIAVLSLYTSAVIEKDLGNKLHNMKQLYTPVSDYLFDFLKPLFKEILPDDNKYEHYFDLFEYLIALVHADLNEKNTGGIWGQPGSFAWRRGYFQQRMSAHIQEFEINSWESELQKITDFLIYQGCFQGSKERYSLIKDKYSEILNYLRWY